jgi:hypothetical protein
MTKLRTTNDDALPTPEAYDTRIAQLRPLLLNPAGDHAKTLRRISRLKEMKAARFGSVLLSVPAVIDAALLASKSDIEAGFAMA